MLTYSAYESGHLPVAGGLDEQPALFLPIMAIISAAIKDEAEYERGSEPAGVAGDAGTGANPMLR